MRKSILLLVILFSFLILNIGCKRNNIPTDENIKDEMETERDHTKTKIEPADTMEVNSDLE